MALHRAGRALAAACAAALTVPLLLTTPAAAASSRVGIPDSRPTWATSETATTTGPAAGQRLSVRVLLAMRDATAAQALARQVSDPTSPRYGHYLTPQAFNARFAPTADSVARVRGFLAGSGLLIDHVAQGNRWVNASGTVAQLDAAFATTLKYFTVEGRVLRAPASAVSVPASLTGLVAGVTGLAESVSRKRPDHRTIAADRASARTAAGVSPSTSPAAAKPAPSKCSNFWGEHTQWLPQAFLRHHYNTYICGYGPAQFRTAYGTAAAARAGQTGKGVTVAIIDAYASPTMLADANAYSKTFGEPVFAKGQYTETTFGPFDLQTECAGEAGWNGEETLDVEAVHAMAPGAGIHYIGAQNCDAGIDDALNDVVQNHVADIVSNSYGNQGEQVPAAEIALEHSIFIQAATEGIGMYFSSGDSGDEVVNGLTPQPDYPGSDPQVTSVGGTSLLMDSRYHTFAELGWETTLDFVDYSKAKATYSSPLPGDFYFGAGGGRSTVFAQPYYQVGTVPTALATGGTTKRRVAPDVAAAGDPYTGFYYGQTVGGTFTIDSIGGTSLSAPLVAGIQAMASQRRSFPIGFANPLLYSLPSSAFHDIVSHTPLHYASVSGGYLGTFDNGDTQRTRIGYDDTTGRGTPNGTVLLKVEATH